MQKQIYVYMKPQSCFILNVLLLALSNAKGTLKHTCTHKFNVFISPLPVLFF